MLPPEALKRVGLVVAMRLVRMTSIVALAALAAGLIAPSGAHAYLYCTEPTKPYVPQATATDANGMMQAQAQMQTYNAAVDAYVECLRQAAEATQAERIDLNRQWEYTVNYYNSLHPPQ
jgi:hypothetical protein